MKTIILVLSLVAGVGHAAPKGRSTDPRPRSSLGVDLMRIVRGLQSVSNDLRVEELRERPVEVRAVSATVLRPLTMTELERMIDERFGSWAAAVEYAGFAADHLPDPNPDLKEWSIEEASARSELIHREYGLHARGILSQARDIEALWIERGLEPASTLGLWRFAKAIAGSWENFVHLHVSHEVTRTIRAFQHPSSACERLILGTPVIDQRRAKSLELWRAFEMSSWGKQYPKLAHQLHAYVMVHGDFEDAADVYAWLVRTMPGLEGLGDWAEIIDRLGRPNGAKAAPQSRPDLPGKARRGYGVSVPDVRKKPRKGT